MFFHLASQLIYCLEFLKSLVKDIGVGYNLTSSLHEDIRGILNSFTYPPTILILIERYCLGLRIDKPSSLHRSLAFLTFILFWALLLNYLINY